MSDQFPPVLLHALDQHIRRIAEEVADERLRHIGLTDSRPWLTTTEAAQQLGCTPRAVRMRHQRGRLEGRYHGRRLYISSASVLELRSR